MIIVYIIVILFFGIGVIIPLMQNEFTGSTESQADYKKVSSDLSRDDDSRSSYFSWYSIPLAILQMFTWSFNVFGGGILELFINILILLPIRILLYLTLARNIWVGGGG